MLALVLLCFIIIAANLLQGWLGIKYFRKLHLFGVFGCFVRDDLYTPASAISSRKILVYLFSIKTDAPLLSSFSRFLLGKPLHVLTGPSSNFT
jgi:hypothetical protein